MSRQALVHRQGWPATFVTVIAWFSAGMLVFTLWTLYRAMGSRVQHAFDADLTVLGMFWAVGPPVWFWFEYYFLWDRDRDTFERLKHGQALSAAIWLATLGSIVAYLKLSG